MYLFINHQFFEILGFEKTFKAKPEPQAFLRVKIRSIGLSNAGEMSVYPSSIYWKYFMFCLNNPDCLPHHMQSNDLIFK